MVYCVRSFFPKTISSIGDYAFDWCDNLTIYCFAGSYAEQYARRNGIRYTTLREKTVTIITTANDIVTLTLNKKTDIPANFIENSQIKPTDVKNIIIGKGITSIEERAFEYCKNLVYITILDSVTSIGREAFQFCESLTSITIFDSVTSIGREAFYGCRNLTSITIPDSVTSIGWRAFWDCSSLTSITIPDSVTSIEKETFYGCSSLESITIPDSVTFIGYGAFSGCKSLTSITIPDSVTSIGVDVFSGCYSLKIYCSVESYARKYAEDNEIKYVII